MLADFNFRTYAHKPGFYDKSGLGSKLSKKKPGL